MNLAQALVAMRQEKHDQAAELLKAQYTYRMFDISEFMKTFKQRLSQSYNARHGRKGVLWEERFKSILIQGRTGHALATVAAYIDLNAVRAGLVSDPKDYRYCGYGEAVAGSVQAREGLGFPRPMIGGFDDLFTVRRLRLSVITASLTG